MTDPRVQELLDDSSVGYAVTCDECRGRRHLNGLLCPKCDGNGRIFIPPKPGSFFVRIRRRIVKFFGRR